MERKGAKRGIRGGGEIERGWGRRIRRGVGKRDERRRVRRKGKREG